MCSYVFLDFVTRSYIVLYLLRRSFIVYGMLERALSPGPHAVVVGVQPNDRIGIL